MIRLSYAKRFSTTFNNYSNCSSSRWIFNLPKQIKNSPSSKVSTQVTAAPILRNESTNSVNLTWKTYTGSLKTFSLNYPSSLVIKEGKGDKPNTEEVSLHPNFVSDTGNLIGNGKPEDIFQLAISVSPNKDNATNNSFKEKILNDAKNSANENKGGWVGQNAQEVYEIIKSTMKPYKNGDIDGYYYSERTHTSVWSRIFQIKGGKIYQMVYFGDQGNPVSIDTEQSIQQILSTFKFIQ